MYCAFHGEYTVLRSVVPNFIVVVALYQMLLRRTNGVEGRGIGVSAGCKECRTAVASAGSAGSRRAQKISAKLGKLVGSVMLLPSLANRTRTCDRLRHGNGLAPHSFVRSDNTQGPGASTHAHAVRSLSGFGFAVERLTTPPCV